MRLTINIAFVAMLLVPTFTIADEKGWSWGQENTDQQTQKDEKYEELQTSASEDIPDIHVNSTEADEIIEYILASNREGKSLDGFGEVYSDPNVQEVIQKGDDGEARNIIKERLCYLGLMQVRLICSRLTCC